MRNSVVGLFIAVASIGLASHPVLGATYKIQGDVTSNTLKLADTVNLGTCDVNSAGTIVYQNETATAGARIIFCGQATKGSGTYNWYKLAIDNSSLYSYYDSLSAASVSSGDLVSLDTKKFNSIARAQSETYKVVLGVVAPPLDYNAPLSLTDMYRHEMEKQGKKTVLIIGKASVKVKIRKNSSLSIGDRITSSELSGIGEKAGSGERAIGIALLPFHPNAGACQKVKNVRSIDWNSFPKGGIDGTSCYQLEDGSIVGEVLVQIQPGL